MNIDVAFWWPVIGLVWLCAGFLGCGVAWSLKYYNLSAACLLAGFVMMCGWPILISAGALIGAGYGISNAIKWLSTH